MNIHYIVIVRSRVPSRRFLQRHRLPSIHRIGPKLKHNTFSVKLNTIGLHNTITCSSAQSTQTWPTVHYNVSEYIG